MANIIILRFRLFGVQVSGGQKLESKIISPELAGSNAHGVKSTTWEVET